MLVTAVVFLRRKEEILCALFSVDCRAWMLASRRPTSEDVASPRKEWGRLDLILLFIILETLDWLVVSKSRSTFEQISINLGI